MGLEFQMRSILKHKTGIDAPTLILASTVIDWKDKGDAQTGLNSANGVKIGPKADIPY